jgi:hypothetical protein
MPEFEKLPEGYSIDRRIEESRVSQEQQEGAGYEALPQGYRLPGTEPTAYEKDYAAMPWSEVASSAAKEAIPSFGRALKAIPEAVINYEETGQALKQAAQGAGSKIRGAFGEKQDPAQKAETEGVINAIFEPFTSVAGFKKALATDPFSVLSTAAIPVTGGAAGLAKGAQLAGTATTAGKALSGLSKAAGTTATLMDPLSTTMAAGKIAGEKIVSPLAKKTAAEASGVSPTALEQAYQAGKSPDAAIKDSFNTFATGQKSAVDLSQDMSQAVRSLRDAEMAKWGKTKEGILELQQDVPFDKILKSIEDARGRIGPIETARINGIRAHKVLDSIEEDLLQRQAMPAGSFGKSVAGLDQLKRELYAEQATAPNKMAETALKNVYAGITGTLGDTAPQYTKLMRDYERLLDNMGTIKSTLGTREGANASAEMIKLIKAQNDLTKNKFILQLAEHDPTLPYKIAGAAIHEAAGKPFNWVNSLTPAQMANLAGSFYSGIPGHTATSALMIAGQRMLTPANVGQISYGAGRVAGSRPVQALEEAAPAITAGRRAIQGPLQRTQDEELMEQFRPQRASGGRVSDKLVTMVDRARKNINNQTESLLSTHDNHVARALEIANQNLEG